MTPRHKRVKRFLHLSRERTVGQQAMIHSPARAMAAIQGMGKPALVG